MLSHNLAFLQSNLRRNKSVRCCYRFSHILVDQQGGVTSVTLNRANKRNALSPQMVESLLEVMESSKSNGTRLLVFKGNGKSMCSGFDFSGIEHQTDADLVLRFIRLEHLLQSVYHAPFHTLSLIQGSCFGAGADLAVSCSYKVSTEDAKFRMPGLKFGIVLGTHRLAHIVGTHQARSLLETCRVFEAKEAYQCGFVNKLAKEDEWDVIIKERFDVATSLNAEVQAAMLDRTRLTDTRDHDLAALVRSASKPGLQQRITQFIHQKK